jgi:hypothetical protein
MAQTVTVALVNSGGRLDHEGAKLALIVAGHYLPNEQNDDVFAMTFAVFNGIEKSNVLRNVEAN